MLRTTYNGMNNNRIFYILVGGIVILVLITVVFVLKGFGGGSQGQRVSLTFWGVFDNRNAFEKIVADYHNTYQNITVNYKLIPYEDYEKTLIDALASGTGPDIIMIHNSWLPKHKDKLKPAPSILPNEKDPFMTIKDYQDQFADVAYKDLVVGKEIYGFPLYVDTLALFYNKDLFNNAGLTRPPKTWGEFNSYVETLTKLDNGTISKAGAAIGTARNINRSSDLLMALMIQSGVQMTDAGNRVANFSTPVGGERVGERSLEYYTSFADPRSRAYTWNDDQNYSIDAFIEGKAAMMINYSHQISVIKSKSARLNFAVAPMPQANPDDAKNYADYWGVSVSNKSANSDEAWKFLKYLTSKIGAIDYLNSTGRPSARKDVIDLQKNDFDLGLFARQSLTAKSWYQIDDLAIDKIFADMIDDVNFKRLSVKESIRNAESRVNVIMQNKQGY